MKKINKNIKNKVLLFAITIAFCAIATTTLAMTTVSLSPVSVNVEEGQTFNLAVSINSQVVKSYMVKSEIKFPADVLEVESFNFGNSWVQLSQSGYDLIDNTNGVLIKTAGYPGGLSSQADFGTIVFKAKKNGMGAVLVTENSLALNADNLNVISGLPITASVTITQTQAQVVPPTPAAQTQQGAAVNPTSVPSLPVTEEQTAQPVAVPQTAAAQAAQQTSLVATIGGFLTLGTGNVWLGIIVGPIILAIVVYVVYVVAKRKKKNLGGM